MHGDKMKKTVQLQYKSIFKYKDHHETVQYQAKGTYLKDEKKEQLSFYHDDQKIEITIRGQDVTLVHGPSLLSLSYHRRLFNHYATPYGMIELYGELVSLHHDRNIQMKYVLSDESEIISEVYLLIRYEEIS